MQFEDNHTQFDNNSGKVLQIIIKTLTGKTIIIRAQTSDTIDTIEGRIEDKLDIRKDQQNMDSAAKQSSRVVNFRQPTLAAMIQCLF